MKLPIEKKYLIDHLTIPTKLQLGLISIDFTFLANQKTAAISKRHLISLVKIIKQDYEHYFNEPFNVSHQSLYIEIWGHLVVYKLMLTYKNVIKLNVFTKLADKIAQRAATADCGESNFDTNRWIWDFTAWLSLKFSKDITKL